MAGKLKTADFSFGSIFSVIDTAGASTAGPSAVNKRDKPIAINIGIPAAKSLHARLNNSMSAVPVLPASILSMSERIKKHEAWVSDTVEASKGSNYVPPATAPVQFGNRRMTRRGKGRSFSDEEPPHVSLWQKESNSDDFAPRPRLRLGTRDGVSVVLDNPTHSIF